MIVIHVRAFVELSNWFLKLAAIDEDFDPTKEDILIPPGWSTEMKTVLVNPLLFSMQWILAKMEHDAILYMLRFSGVAVTASEAGNLLFL